jgi:hypothetical protein
MKVLEVTGRAMKRQRWQDAPYWRCGAPWPTTGPAVTHQLRLVTKDELELTELVVDEQTGLPRSKVDAQGRSTGEPERRTVISIGSGAPMRRALKWCVRADGSRVVETLADSWERAQSDELFEVLDVKEVPLTEIVSIADAAPGSQFEKVSPR